MRMTQIRRAGIAELKTPAYPQQCYDGPYTTNCGRIIETLLELSPARHYTRS